MDLILVRHAKSLHNDYVERDMERHLSDRGYQDAAASANWCIRNGILPELIVSSPAIRAYSTALIFANRLSVNPQSIRLNAAIYEAGVRQLLYALSEIESTLKTVMLFGHNPGFTELVNYLCGPVCPHLPTAGVACIQLPGPGGELLPSKCGKLRQLYSGHKPL